MHYYCKACGHYYGYRRESLPDPAIALHCNVWHAGQTATVEAR